MGRLAILIVLLASSAHAYQPRQPAGFGTYSKAYTERAQAPEPSDDLMAALEASLKGSKR